MSADPIKRLPGTFGKLLARLRVERQLTEEAFAAVAGLRDADTVTKMEQGKREPTLSDFFRIANALRSQPAILFVDVMAAWRADPDTLHTSRSSDFTRLFRLGYLHKPGDFRELSTTYYSVAEATHAAVKLNAQRHTRGVTLLDTVLIYVRLGNVNFRPDPDKEAP